jgi:membrane protein implicated in regulation of membrane protease activity
MPIDSPTLAWAILAIAAALVEVLTPHFGVIFVSGGALAGALVAWVGGSLAWQVLTCVVVVAASLVLLRPRMVSKLGARGVPSRTETLIGKRGQVTEEINVTLGTGRLNVAGEDWAARSVDTIPAGTDVRVTGADGIVLQVRRL